MTNPIYARYSCRRFTGEPVTREQLTAVMRAGMQAPSAKNEQPWEFLTVTSHKGREALAEASPYAGSCRTAPAVIVALADLNRVDPGSPWWIQDMSACIENMLLEAVQLGLGAVWLGMYPREDRVSAIRAAFGLPETLIPVAAIPVGVPAADPAADPAKASTAVSAADPAEASAAVPAAEETGHGPKNRFDPARIRWEEPAFAREENEI